MQAQPVGTHSLTGIVESARLEDVARIMTRKNIAALGVYAPNAKDLIGVVTERDLTHAVAEGRNPARTRVSDVMSKSPIVTDGPISSSEALQLMHERNVRHLIVRENGRHRVVSIRDL